MNMTKEIGETKTVRLPFAGLYYSLIDMEVDSCISREIEYAEIDCDEGRKEAIESFTYLNGAGEQIAKAYAEWVSGEIELDIEFIAMRSPRFCNFETDEILVNINTDDLPSLTDSLKNELADMAKDLYTSRDGYISFVDPDISKVFNLDYSQWDTAYLDLIVIAVCANRFDSDRSLVTAMEAEWVESEGYEVISNVVCDEVYNQDSSGKGTG